MGLAYYPTLFFSWRGWKAKNNCDTINKYAAGYVGREKAYLFGHDKNTEKENSSGRKEESVEYGTDTDGFGERAGWKAADEAGGTCYYGTDCQHAL